MADKLMEIVSKLNPKSVDSAAKKYGTVLNGANALGMLKLSDDMKIKELKKKYCQILNSEDIIPYVREHFKKFVSSFFEKLIYDETVFEKTKEGTETESQKNSLRKHLDQFIESQLIEMVTENMGSKFIPYFYTIELLNHSFVDIEGNQHNFFTESGLSSKIEIVCNIAKKRNLDLNVNSVSIEMYNAIVKALDITQKEMEESLSEIVTPPTTQEGSPVPVVSNDIKKGGVGLNMVGKAMDMFGKASDAANQGSKMIENITDAAAQTTQKIDQLKQAADKVNSVATDTANKVKDGIKEAKDVAGNISNLPLPATENPINTITQGLNQTQNLSNNLSSVIKNQGQGMGNIISDAASFIPSLLPTGTPPISSGNETPTKTNPLKSMITQMGVGQHDIPTKLEISECKKTLKDLVESCSSGEGESKDGMHEAIFYIVKNKFQNSIKDKTSFMVEDSQKYEAARKEGKVLTDEEKTKLQSMRYYAFSHMSEYIEKKSISLLKNSFLSQYDIKFHKKMLHALIQDPKMKKIILSAIYDTYTKAKGEDSIFKIDSSVIRRNIVSRLNPFFFLNNLSTENHEMEEVATVNALTGISSAIEEAITPAESIGNKFNKDNIIIYQGKDYEIIGLTKGKKNNNKVYYVIQSVEEGDEEGTIILIPEDDNIKLKEPPVDLTSEATTEDATIKEATNNLTSDATTKKDEKIDPVTEAKIISLEEKMKELDGFSTASESKLTSDVSTEPNKTVSKETIEKLTDTSVPLVEKPVNTTTPEEKKTSLENNQTKSEIKDQNKDQAKDQAKDQTKDQPKDQTKDQTKSETKDQPKKGGSLTRRKQNKKKTLKRRKSYSSPTMSSIRKGKNTKTSKTISNETRRPKKFSIVYRSLPNPK